MAERLYAGCTNAELAANADQMSMAEIMCLQMWSRPAAGEPLPEMPDGKVPDALRRQLGG